MTATNEQEYARAVDLHKRAQNDSRALQEAISYVELAKSKLGGAYQGFTALISLLSAARYLLNDELLDNIVREQERSEAAAVAWQKQKDQS